MTDRKNRWLVCMASLVLASGCAPKDYVDGVAWTIRSTGRSNAATQTLEGRPYLRADAITLNALSAVSRHERLSEARRKLKATLARCHELAKSAVNDEFDHLSPGALRSLSRRYLSDEPMASRLPGALRERSWRLVRSLDDELHIPNEPIPNDLRGVLRDQFWRVAHARYVELLGTIDEQSTIQGVHDIANSLRGTVRPSPKDNHGHGFILDLVSSSFEEDRRPLDRGGPQIDVYEPDFVVGSGSAAEHSSEDRLLARFSPIIVQERVPNASYATTVDIIGTVEVEGTLRKNRVVVATSSASLYGYAQPTMVDGRRHTQLTYTWWFPEHPKLKPMDAEAGRIEGATLRITLDSNDRPALFETVLNCGCFHRAYPSASVEAASCATFASPLPGKKFCVEREVADKIDWVVAETVEVADGPNARPIVFSRAGYHGPAGVSFDLEEIKQRTVLQHRPYAFRSYMDLERLPVGEGFASMFGPDGLVRGAGRLEGLLLSPTGMLSAGQPRQRGTQLLHWDQYDFDDPHLLDTCLRLPNDF